MAEYSKEEMLIGIGKESPRGTETSALSVAVPIDRGSDMDYHPVFIEDDKTRGLKDRFKPTLVMNEGVGSLSGMSVEPLNIGYFLMSLFGTSTPSLVGPTIAYEHVFTRLAGVVMPSYSIVIDRQISKKAYLLSVVKSMTLNSPFNDKVMADFELLFKTEATSALAMPSITEPDPFKYHQVQVYIDDVGASKPAADTEIRELSLTFDNQSIIKRTYNNSLDIKDIVTPEKFLLSGTFVRYFDTEAERAKFLAGTARALWIDITGALIETTYYNAIEITIPQMFYKAVPFGEVEGMLAAAVAFDCYYNVASAKSVSVLLRNTDTAY